MRSAPRAGFTFLELIIATFLASIVLITLSSILTPLVLSQVYSASAQNVQLNLAAVDQLVERELRQASMVTQPATAGIPSGVLEGCDNAVVLRTSPTPPAPPPVALDPSSPMKWFAFCTAGGIVYYHTGAGCPAAYTCGASPTSSFTWGPMPWSSLTFTLPSAGSTLVTAVMSASSGSSGIVVTSTSSVAFSAAAGGAQ